MLDEYARQIATIRATQAWLRAALTPPGGWGMVNSEIAHTRDLIARLDTVAAELHALLDQERRLASRTYTS